MDRLVGHGAVQRTSHDTHHTVEPDWPLALGVDDRGSSIHVCRDCGAQIPDGACVERDPLGRVLAWTPAGTDPTGEPLRNIVHECAGP